MMVMEGAIHGGDGGDGGRGGDATHDGDGGEDGDSRGGVDICTIGCRRISGYGRSRAAPYSISKCLIRGTCNTYTNVDIILVH